MDLNFLTKESQYYGVYLFVAIVLFQMVFIFIQWLIYKRVDYLFYIGYMISIVLYAFSLYKHLFIQEFPEGYSAAIETFLKQSLPLISITLYSGFQRHFLELKTSSPLLNTRVKWIERFLIAFCCFLPVLLFFEVERIYMLQIFIVVCCIVIAALVLIIRRVLKACLPFQRFAIAGALFIIVGSIPTIILGFYEDRGYEVAVNPHLPLMICVILELLTFTTGLTLKSYYIEKEKRVLEKAMAIQINNQKQTEIEYLKMRNNVSRKLHDSLGAELSIAKMMLSTLPKEKAETNKKTLSDSIKLIGNSIEKVYDLMNDVNKITSEEVNVVSSIQTLIDNLKPLNNIKWHFDYKLEEECLSLVKRQHVFLIIKELINNTLKYASATTISISIRHEFNAVNFFYHDNGSGTDLDKLSKGNGLKYINERVAEMDGHMQIYSTPNDGFTVQINISET